jgi:hypothetical protein
MERILGTGSRVEHPTFGVGVVVGLRPTAYQIVFIDHGLKEIALVAADKLTVIEATDPPEGTVSLTDVERILISILRRYSDLTEVVPLGDKWINGKLILEPGRKDTVGKEVPIEDFFHKIVMVRDRLRVMEQKINACKGLNDEEKVDLQQYITRIYGSLTTFNVLFKHNSDHFVGQKGSR